METRIKQYTTPQAAEYLTEERGVQVASGTLEVWRAQGRGPEFRKVHHRVFYTQPALDRFADGRVVKTIDSVELEGVRND